MLTACGGSTGVPAPVEVVDPTPVDDYTLIQSAVDKGGTVTLEARTYHINKTIVIRRSNTTLQGAGPATVIEYATTREASFQHCANDRVITTPCDANDIVSRQITKPISVGDTSFTAAADASDVQPGEWLLINDYDAVFGDRIAVDWVQVAAVDGPVIHVTEPFRIAFTTAREWIPAKSGLGFVRMPKLIENTTLQNFNVTVPDTGDATASAAGISIFMALNTTIEGVSVNNPKGQPLYMYLSKGVTIRHSDGRGRDILSEFASSVDVTVCDNVFAVDNSAGFGLDLGLAFFDICRNQVTVSRNVGAYMLYGVHDGAFRDNRISYVNADGRSAVGILAQGAQNVSITDNVVDGGAGDASIGIQIQGADGALPIPPTGITVSNNSFGAAWSTDVAQ